MTDMQKGAAAAFLSYIWWGAMPPYWKLLSGVSSVEILLHRVIWSAVFMLLLLAASRRLGAAFDSCGRSRATRYGSSGAAC